MKNIYIFIVFVCTLGLLCAPRQLEAEPLIALPFGKLPYALGLSTSFGMFYGQAEEIVYHDVDKDEYLSQLLWDMKPLFYYGAGISYAPLKPLEKAALFAEISLKSAIPADTGIMEDRDWMAPDHGYSHFSTHTNFTGGGIFADFGLGLSFPLWKKILLKTGLWLSVIYISWESRDGYLQHANGDKTYGSYDLWDSSITKIYHFGPAINYSQSWMILSPGLDLQIPFSRFFSLDLSLLVGPVIDARAQDVHSGWPDKLFLDYMSGMSGMSGGILLEPRGEFTFSPFEKLKLSWYISYRHISGSRGETYSRTTSQSTTPNSALFSKSNSDSGAAFRVLDTGLSLKICF
jgi:outer membrane protease